MTINNKIADLWAKTDIMGALSQVVDAKHLSATSTAANAPWNKKRPNLFPGIQKYLFQQKEVELQPVSIGLKDGQQHVLLVAKCQYCARFDSAMAMQVDHIIPWAKFITHNSTDPTNLEARILYNDLHNIRLLCGTCNRSHPEDKKVFETTRGRADKNVMDTIKKWTDMDPDPD